MCRTDTRGVRGAGTRPRSGSHLCDITVAVMFVLFVIAMFMGVV